MSWKKYGGLNKLEKINNITVTSIVTDTFTVRQSFLNTFNVEGNLEVFGNTTTQNLTIKPGGKITTDSITTNHLNLFDPASAGTAFIEYNSNFIKNNKNILISNTGTTTNGITINNSASSSSIKIFQDINNISNPTAALEYFNSGVLQLTSAGYTHIYNRLAVSKPNRNVSSSIFDETAVIYDVSSGPYKNNIYGKPLAKTGNALTLVSADNSSNTFLNIVSPGGSGLNIGGGLYPNDITRSMAVFQVNNNYAPNQIIVSGNSSTNYHSTVGFNTYVPNVDNFAIDINGPVHVNNGDVNLTNQPSFQINRTRSAKSNPRYAIAIGSCYNQSTAKFAALYSTNGGLTWNQSSNLDGTISNTTQFTSCYVYDSNNSIIVGTNSNAQYSNNSGSTWQFIGITTANFNDIYVANPSKTGFVVYNAGYSYFTINFNSGVSNVNNITQTGFNIKGVDGSANKIFLVGGRTIKRLDISDPGTIESTYTTSSLTADYNSVSVFNSNYVVAVGANIISYSTNNGTNWSDILISDTLTNVYIYDTSNAIAVGNAGAIYITRNGTKLWNKVDNNLFNSNGIASKVLNNTKNISGVFLSDPNTINISIIDIPFVLGTTTGSSLFYSLFTPYFANNSNNYVFDVCGNMRVSGDLYINDYGKLKTNNDTFDLLTDVNTLNVGGNSNSISIGSVNGTIYANSNFIFDNPDTSLNLNTIHISNISTNRKFSQNMTIGASGDSTIFYGNLDLSTTNLLVAQPLSNVLTGLVNYSNPTDTSGVNTGALVVQGGASVQKHLVVGQEIYTLGIDALPLTANENYLNIGCDSSTNYINIGQNKQTTIINLGNIRNDNQPLPGDGPTTINIGASGDFIYIRGNLILPGNISTFDVSNLRVDDQVIMLNQNAKGNGVSRGCGILIRDNGDDRNAYMISDTNTRGYIFKTGSSLNKLDLRTDLLSTFGMPNINGFVCVRPSQSGLGESDSDYTLFSTNSVQSSLIIDDTTSSSNDITGALQVRGGAGISGNLFVGQKTTSTNMFVSNDASFTNMYVSTGSIIDSILNVRNQTESSSTTTGALQIAGGAGVSGNIFVGKTTNSTNMFVSNDASFANMYALNNANIGCILKVNNTTESSSTSSGSLQISGGAGVVGNMYVGKTMNSTNMYVSNDTSLNSNLYLLSGSIINSGNFWQF